MVALNKLDEQAWRAWYMTRPEIIQQMAQKYPPNLLYRLRTTKQYVTLESFSEDGTVTVAVGAEFNRLIEERRVFGIPAEDLEESDFPPDGYVVGLLPNYRPFSRAAWMEKFSG